MMESSVRENYFRILLWADEEGDTECLQLLFRGCVMYAVRSILRSLRKSQQYVNNLLRVLQGFDY